jgi:glycosyltransferase involved in cell wall biosynthesis
MISIREIGATRTPIVWTLHDEWVFRGAEHFPTADGDVRYEQSYRPESGHVDRRRLDVDRWTWRRKQVAWRRPMTAVCPSQWLAGRARRSPLLDKWRIETIPNSIDTSVWQPRCQVAARRRFDLPLDIALVVFGAIGGSSDPRKGGDLLRAALQQLPSRLERPWALAIFGQAAPVVPESWPAPIYYLGHLSRETDLIDAYSAADVVVLPSRLENLPNLAIEAQSCAVPVVAFATGGVPECVEHGHTGYLASAFDIQDLAHGIAWVLADGDRHRELSANARAYVVKNFASPRIARRLENLYEDLISNHPKASA